MINNANFIAVDFETATPQRDACQIGIVVVKEGTIVEKISRFIQPPRNQYAKRCIKVHGITPEMTKDAPAFNVVWEEIKEYFEGNFIVAHNISFDLDILNKSLDLYHLEHPIFMGSACTYRIYDLSLEDACNEYNIPLCNHHDGVCDAEACARLFLKYLSGEYKENKTDNKNTLENYIPLKSNNYFNPFEHEEFLKECCINDPLDCFSDKILSELPNLPLFVGKRFIITGGTIFDRDKAYKIIKCLGGKKTSSINKLLDYAIIGELPGPKKMEQLEELSRSGVSINIMSDREFIAFLKTSLENILNER